MSYIIFSVYEPDIWVLGYMTNLRKTPVGIDIDSLVSVSVPSAFTPGLLPISIIILTLLLVIECCLWPLRILQLIFASIRELTIAYQYLLLSAQLQNTISTGFLKLSLEAHIVLPNV